MNQTVKKIENILTDEFSVENYTNFIREIFPSVSIIAPDIFNKEFSNFSSHIEGSIHIGTYESPDNKNIIIHAVKLKKESYVENARSTQRSYAKKLIEAGNADAAIIGFYTEGENKWRLSFVRLDYEIKIKNGRLKTEENITPAKRFSYLVGKDEPCHTAISRFHRFITDDTNTVKPTLEDLEEAFSVEKVTKEFFDLYVEKFHKLREALEKNKDFVIEAKQHNFTTAQFAKKLMGQIVFLYFLQKKGWLGVPAWNKYINEKQFKDAVYKKGHKSRELIPQIYTKIEEDKYRLEPKKLKQLSDEDESILAGCIEGGAWGTGSKKFMRELFDICQAEGGNFFDDYLEPLFYNALNRHRERDYYAKLHCRIPFLSGGLFEPIDGYDWEHNDFAIPNNVFSNKNEKGDRDADGILDIFDRYNFTMSEDEPMEREVAIDPEMLGKVFENLLEVKDRKSKGAFYTPREIVHFMCQETLISYLAKKTKLKESDIRDFILMGDFMKDEDTSKDKRLGNDGMFISENIYKLDENGEVIKNRLKEIDDALADVRVVDLAVGSGAFPLGMLNEIVRARQNISSYMAITMKPADIRWMYNNERSPYKLKRETIKNCIFGADIEPSAVDIAQLRLWLSLVIDDEINPNATGIAEGHRNPTPLPNLECNIVCGNSLIDEFNGVELINHSELIGTQESQQIFDFFTSSYNAILPDLIETQNEFFGCEDTNKKNELKERIEELKLELVKVQMESESEETWNEFVEAQKSASRPFVMWQLEFAKVFREKGGFDIVIGNPPYLGESGNKDKFRRVAATKFGKKYYNGKMDYFYFFYHKGLDLVVPGGEVSLITTNYFTTATGAKTLRADLKERALIRKFVDFNEVKVFESAQGQHNIITLLTKKEDEEKRQVICTSIVCKGSYLASSNQISNILEGKEDNITVSNVEQDNLYDGEEAYIRLRGVMNNDENTIESVLSKISSVGSPLDAYFEVSQGVVTGCDTLTNKHLSKLPDDTDRVKNDGIFVLDLQFERDMEFYNSVKEEGKDLLKDFYKNSDIAKYYCSDKATKKIIYYTGELDEKKYPNIYEHMLKYRPILEGRLKTYDEKYHWTAIHRPRNQEMFENGVPKIVVPYRTKKSAFAYNDIEWFCRSDCYVITSKNNDINIKSLLAMLNSDTYFCWLYHRGKRKGEVLELFQKPLAEIPIIIPPDSTQNELVDIVDEIINIKKDNPQKDTSELEEKINNIVYKIFDFSDKDISLIKKENKN